MLTAGILFVEAFLRCAPGVFLFLYTFRESWRYPKKQVILCAILYIILTMFLPVGLYQLLPEKAWLMVFTILHFSITFMCSLLVVKFSYDRVLLVFFIIDNYMDAIALLRDSVGNYCDGLLQAYGYFPLSLWLRCIILIITFPMMLAFCNNIIRPLVIKQVSAPFYQYLWTIPACFLVMYHLCINPQNISEISYVFNPVPISVMLIWILGTFFIYSLIIQMFEKTLEKAEIQQELERVSVISGIQMKFYENLLTQVKKNRKDHHDFRHQILMIKQYCDEHEYEKLSAYLHEYVEGLQLDQRMYYCEHGIINGVLQYYDELAKTLDVEMSVDVNIPKHLSIPDVDICSLFCNAIENALEACERIKEGKRWIKVKADVFQTETLVIRIVNSYNGKLHTSTNGQLMSSKRNEEGIGISSMKEICKHYQGICQYTYDDESFVLELMLMAHQGGIS